MEQYPRKETLYGFGPIWRKIQMNLRNGKAFCPLISWVSLYTHYMYNLIFGPEVLLVFYVFSLVTSEGKNACSCYREHSNPFRCGFYIKESYLYCIELNTIAYGGFAVAKWVQFFITLIFCRGICGRMGHILPQFQWERLHLLCTAESLQLIVFNSNCRIQ